MTIENRLRRRLPGLFARASTTGVGSRSRGVSISGETLGGETEVTAVVPLRERVGGADLYSFSCLDDLPCPKFFSNLYPSTNDACCGLGKHVRQRQSHASLH